VQPGDSDCLERVPEASPTGWGQGYALPKLGALRSVLFGGPPVLIDEQYRKCVAFLYADVREEETNAIRRMPVATVFFVGVEVGSNAFVPYAVTARHVVDQSRPHGPLYARLNLKAGGVGDLQVDADAWTTHSSTDVAVARIGAIEQADMIVIPASMLATDDFIRDKGISEGDDVFFTGLFNPHPGTQRNQPIVRFGNVSLMPREPLLLSPNPPISPTIKPLRVREEG